MTIRHATIDDLDIILLIETTSFHKTEAAKKRGNQGANTVKRRFLLAP